MSSPGPQLASHDQICLLLRKSGAQIDELVKKSGLPREKGKAKRYNLQRVIHWLIDQNKKEIEEAYRKRTEWPVGDIAAALHRDVRTINILAKDKGLPRIRRGVYNIIDVFQFIIKDLEYKLQEAKAGGQDALNAKRKEATFNALIREKQYYDMAKRTVDIEDVHRMITIPWKATQTKLLALPRQLAPQLEGLTIPEKEELLENKIHDSLRECAKIPIASGSTRSTAEGDHRSVAGVTPAAKSHRKRVGRRISRSKQ